jgi:hypothetical protein
MVKTRFNHGWSRRGFCILWDPNTLSELVDPQKVISIRQLFAMAESWPEELPAANGDAVVAAGLEGVLDILDGDDAEQWIETELHRVILSFQEHYNSSTCLVLWMPSGRNRISMRGASEQYFYKHTHSESKELPIGRLLWSGVESEIERIMSTQDQSADCDGKHWAGLYHPRIS